MAVTARSPLDARLTKERYGPWAVIAGGSNGTGEGYARELAALGINVVLVARKQETLDALAADLRAEFGIETRTVVQDLMDPKAAQNMLDATADLDVGLYVSNAGADDLAAPFFDEPLERWRRLIQMNVITMTEAVHGFGNRLRQRGRGGLVIMSSGAALGGMPYLQMYSATKSFEMVLAEGLWAELADSDVDVTCVLAPAMDTPFFRRSIVGDTLAQMQAADAIYDPQDVAREALAQLPHKPLLLFQSRTALTPDEVLAGRFETLQRSSGVGKAYSEVREQESAS